jgi:hypothetical protein
MKLALRTALPAVLLMSACQRPQPGVRIDPALATIIPADTVMAAGVKVEAIRQTPLYAKYIEKIEPLRVGDFARKTGFDPRKDLYELLAASNGEDAIVMARGKFSPLGLEPKAGDGIPRTSYKGLTLLGDEKSSIAFINPSVAVAAPLPVLRHFLDHRTETSGPPPALAARLKQIRPDSQVWAAAIGGENLIRLIPQDGNLANLNRVLADVQSATVSIDLRFGLDFLGQAVYSDEKSARQTTEALRALLGFARLNTPSSEPDLLKAYDGIQVNQLNNTMKVTANLTNPMLDRLTEAAQRHSLAR